MSRKDAAISRDSLPEPSLHFSRGSRRIFFFFCHGIDDAALMAMHYVNISALSTRRDISADATYEMSARDEPGWLADFVMPPDGHTPFLPAPLIFAENTTKYSSISRASSSRR